MLIAMRKGAAGWVAKILFGLLILSFAVWGIGDYLTPEADPVVAEVGEIEIRRTSLDRAERAQLERMRRVLGQAFDAGALPENTLRNAALEQLVGQAALDMETRALGLGVSDEAVAAAIRATPSFQAAGRFSADLFRRALFAAGLNEEGYVHSLRGELARNQLGGAIAARLAPSLQLVEAMYGLEKQERDVAFVRAPTEGIETPEPTDEDLKKFIADHAARFAEPERRDVRAIVISIDAVAKAVDITDAEVANRYEDSKGQFQVAETRKLVQALFRDETEARAFVLAPVADTDAFRSAAEVAGATVTDLGERKRQDIFPQALGDAVFAADAGAMPQPVKTALGWHVVYVSEATPASTRPLAEVKDVLKATMQREKAELGLNDYANAVEDALAAGGDIQAASSASGLPIQSFKGVDANGADGAGARSADLPVDPTFLTEAFSRRAGEQSGLIELNDGAFVALIVDAVRVSAPKPFDVVKADAAAGWKTDRQKAIASERVQALVDAKSLTDFESAAAAAGLEVAKTGRLGRVPMGESGALPPALVEAAFAAAESRAVRQDAPGEVIAAFVIEIVKPNFDPNGEDEKTYISQMTNAYANDRVQVLAEVARTAHPPAISGNAMARFEPHNGMPQTY